MNRPPQCSTTSSTSYCVRAKLLALRPIFLVYERRVWDVKRTRARATNQWHRPQLSSAFSGEPLFRDEINQDYFHRKRSLTTVLCLPSMQSSSTVLYLPYLLPLGSTFHAIRINTVLLPSDFVAYLLPHSASTLSHFLHENLFAGHVREHHDSEPGVDLGDFQQPLLTSAARFQRV